MKFAPLAVATTALSEGQTPVGKNISVSEVTATVYEYGDFVRYSKLLSKVAIDPVVTEIAELLGYQAGKTFDTLARDVMVAGCTTQYASTAAARTDITAAMVLSAAEIYEALSTIEAADGLPLDGGKFAGIMHPKPKYDLMRDSTFVNTALYATEPGKANPMHTYKFAEWLGIDWYVTSNAKVYEDGGYGSAVDVYKTLIIAKNAVGVGGLAGDIPGNIANSLQDPNTGKSVSPLALKYVKPAPSPSDPLGQRGSVGWISTFVCAVLDDDWIVGIEHGATL